MMAFIGRNLLLLLGTITFLPESFSLATWDIGDEAIEFTSEWYTSHSLEGAESPIYRSIASIMNYQPSMPLPPDAMDPPTNCPHLASGLKEWDDSTLVWTRSDGTTFTGPPIPDGNDIILPPDTSIILRPGILSGTHDSPYGKITIPVGSKLIFDDDGLGITTLHTLAIVLDGGELLAGSPTCRRSHALLDIILHGEYNANSSETSDRHLKEVAGADFEVKGIVVKDVPTSLWDFHGPLYHPTWTRLAAHIPGSVQQETSAPSTRNRVLYLQDCVNWPLDGEILVTTSRVKDTRDYDYNERGMIDSVRCVTIDSRNYGEVTVKEPLMYYHHAGAHEYQSEVALLTRSIVIRGNDKSDPTDITPLTCTSSISGWTTVPCSDIYTTGLGGHTAVLGEGVGRIRGIEFRKMGMTNVLGRYPIHYHHCVTGEEGIVSDNSIRDSYWRAVTAHDVFKLLIERNVAFDIIGHAYYLESGVEEENFLMYNFASFVHAIGGPAVMQNQFVPSWEAYEDLKVPADRTASGFYISNVYNTVIGNAASGGWAGMQLPVFPQPIDPTLRFNGVVPKDRPTLLISGNSVHSSGFFSQNSGAVYAGGSLYWEENDEASTTLKYNAGRVGSIRLTRSSKNDDGSDAWLQITNTTVWLCNVGSTGWGRRSEISGFEVHDFQRRSIFVLFTVWLNEIVMNCRTSNAPRVPDVGTGSVEKALNAGTKWSGFFTYDHLMKHILTNWKISNCGGEARGLYPWAENGDDIEDSTGFITVPVNGFAPEVQLISSGWEYDWDTLGGTNFVYNSSLFFSGSGSDEFHSMQHMSNWVDADGSLTGRTDTGDNIVLGPAAGGEWWHLDSRPNMCETRIDWKFPQILCNRGNRQLASYMTFVDNAGSSSMSGAAQLLHPNESSNNLRKFRQGSMTHFGLEGDGSIDACEPPTPCQETTSRSWDADITGPYDHSFHGGWYLQWDAGTPAHMRIERIQMIEGTTLINAMSLPPSLTAADVSVWAESYTRRHDFLLVENLWEVRNTIDTYYFDDTTSTLYWSIITGYVDTDSTLSWIDREVNGIQTFSRGGLSVVDTTGQSQYRLHIDLDCETDAVTGAFCEEKPSFNVPGMDCPQDMVRVAIDLCGLECELDDSCQENTSHPTETPLTAGPTDSPITNTPTEAPTDAPQTNAPSDAQTDQPSPTSNDPDVRISLLKISNRLLNGGQKWRTAISMTLRDTLWNKISGVSVSVSWMDINDSSNNGVVTKTTRANGKVGLKLPKFNTNQVDGVVVSIDSISVDGYVYNEELNVEYGGVECPIFSNGCQSVIINKPEA